jgi:biopolymer transport protein ExbB
MAALALVAVALYGSCIRVLLDLAGRGFHKLGENALRDMVRHPSTSFGNLGEIIRYTQDNVASLDDISARFAEVTAAELPRIDRRLAFINVLVATAPLLGLLGTVLGMLVTFSAIAAGGTRMVDAMARGISEALITTEMGLLVALPGMALAYISRRRRNEYAGILATLESVSLRKYRKQFGGMTGHFQKSEDRTAEAVAQ